MTTRMSSAQATRAVGAFLLLVLAASSAVVLVHVSTSPAHSPVAPRGSDREGPPPAPETRTVPSTPSTGQDYSSAVEEAVNISFGFAGQNWSLIEADGYVSPTPFLYGLPLWFFGSFPPNQTGGCGWQALGGTPLNDTVFPATPNDLGPGVSNSWAFVFADPSGAVLVSTVRNGTAALLATLPAGGPCLYEVAYSSVRSSEIDSTQAVRIANAVGGAAFLTSNPGADESFTLVGAEEYPVMYSGPAEGQTPGNGFSSWTVTYSVFVGTGNPSQDLGIYDGNLTRQFSAVLAPSNGTVYMAGVTFPTYTVTFTETGLPADTMWSVSLDYQRIIQSGDLQFVGIPNGTYNFSVGAMEGFAVASAESVTVHGLNVTYQVSFVPTTLFGLPGVEGYYILLVGTIGVALVVAGGVLRWRGYRHRPRAGPPSA